MVTPGGGHLFVCSCGPSAPGGVARQMPGSQPCSALRPLGQAEACPRWAGSDTARRPARAAGVLNNPSGSPASRQPLRRLGYSTGSPVRSVIRRCECAGSDARPRSKSPTVNFDTVEVAGSKPASRTRKAGPCLASGTTAGAAPAPRSTRGPRHDSAATAAGAATRRVVAARAAYDLGHRHTSFRVKFRAGGHQVPGAGSGHSPQGN
jgi:hypothetical protein